MKKDRKKDNEKQDHTDGQDFPFWTDPQPISPWDFQDEFDRPFRQMNEYLNNIFKGISFQSENTDNSTKFYGWRYQLGPDGKPHFEEFSNMPQIKSHNFH